MNHFDLLSPGLKSSRGCCDSKSICVYVGAFMCMFQFVQAFVIRVSFETLKSDHTQTWVKDAVGLLSYVNEVKVHVVILCELL